MKPLTLECELPFGKFKGQQVEDVLADDPTYLRWLMENTKMQFDDETMEALEKREAGKYWK